MRYELNTVIKDNRNLLGNFDAANGLLQVGKGISVPYDGDHNNFAPRFGFAWDTTGTGKTVVRGGGGLTYETVNWESFLALNNSMGLSTIPTGAIIDGAGGTAGGTIAQCLASAPAWDQCASGGDAEQAARPFNGKFPYLANTYQMGNIYKSNYNGLQTTLTSRNFHGLSAVVGYTYSHSLDDVGANWDFGAGSGIPQNNLVPHTEYASSDFDIRHRFTLAMTYLIPGKEGFAQLLKGWQLNSIVTLSSAQPWGPM